METPPTCYNERHVPQPSTDWRNAQSGRLTIVRLWSLMRLSSVLIIQARVRVGCYFLLIVINTLLTIAELHAENRSNEPRDFTHLSLEELGAIEVTSVSKKAEKLTHVPAAVSVITADDIRRSGALTLPDALRLAPGIHVARVDAHQWAVSTRGFNDTFAQKLLVLMDGRSVYTPVIAGTLWQAQDLIFEDVDRIEVIRGPGSSVWGANAVNGVVNVVSKPARETQGMLVSGGGGSDHRILGSLRYGGQIEEHTFFRLYGKFDDWDNSRLLGGGQANDEWWKEQGGFRFDWEPTSDDRLTLQGDLFNLQSNQTMPNIIFPVFGMPPPPGGYNVQLDSKWEQIGGNILGRWTTRLADDSDFSIQTYYDRGEIKLPLLKETRNTFDLDLRHRFQFTERQEIVWGGGYRLNLSNTTNSPEVRFMHDSRSDEVFNAFVQDEITLLPDLLRLTLGTKIEHNNYTGFEVQPGARLSWTPTTKQTIWTSVTRAVRTPAQFEDDAEVHVLVLPADPPFNPFPTVIALTGTPDYESEILIAYELGYRIQPLPRLTLETALFLNDYDRLRSGVSIIDTSAVPNYVKVRNLLNNTAHGQTYGGEIAATWQMLEWWRLQSQYSVIQTDLSDSPNNLTGAPNTPDLSYPNHQISLRSSMNLGKQVEFDLWLHYVDSFFVSGISKIPGTSKSQGDIPSYFTLDVRLAWHPTRNLELALGAQNLIDRHQEFAPTYTSSQSIEVSRSIYGKLTWKF